MKTENPMQLKAFIKSKPRCLVRTQMPRPKGSRIRKFRIKASYLRPRNLVKRRQSRENRIFQERQPTSFIRSIFILLSFGRGMGTGLG